MPDVRQLVTDAPAQSDRAAAEQTRREVDEPPADVRARLHARWEQSPVELRVQFLDVMDQFVQIPDMPARATVGIGHAARAELVTRNKDHAGSSVSPWSASRNG